MREREIEKETVREKQKFRLPAAADTSRASVNRRQWMSSRRETVVVVIIVVAYPCTTNEELL